jgi:transcriptional regulator with XRE-family HTH domain
MKFSEKIKNIRLLQKMTQEEFSCFLGIGYASIQKYESGVRKPGLSIMPLFGTIFFVMLYPLFV